MVHVPRMSEAAESVWIKFLTVYAGRVKRKVNKFTVTGKASLQVEPRHAAGVLRSRPKSVRETRRLRYCIGKGTYSRKGINRWRNVRLLLANTELRQTKNPARFPTAIETPLICWAATSSKGKVRA